MKPHINFLIRCGIILLLILAFIIISCTTDPAEIHPEYIEPARTAPTEAPEPTKKEAYTDMPSSDNEPHAATEQTTEHNTHFPTKS